MKRRRGSLRARTLALRMLVVCTAIGAACSTQPDVADQPAASTSIESSRSAQPDEARPSVSTSTQPSASQSSSTTVETQDPLDLHVAPSGDDDGVGSEQEPLRTIQQALTIVGEGGTITLHEGTYPPFAIRRKSGVTVQAFEDALVVVEAVDYNDGATVRIVRSNDVQLSGLRIQRGIWGVWIERSQNIAVVDNVISDLGQEGIMIKQNTTGVLIEGNEIHGTGRREGQINGTPYAKFGEGIYVGSADGGDEDDRDRSNNIVVRGNTIHNTTAEAVDIKNCFFDVLIERNLVYDVDTTSSGAIVLGTEAEASPTSGVFIRGNVIHSISRTSEYQDGNGIVISAPATVVGNVIWNVEHRGILIDRRLATTTSAGVEIRWNTIREAGGSSIEQLPTSSDVDVIIENNSTAPESGQTQFGVPNVTSAWEEVDRLLAAAGPLDLSAFNGDR